MTFNWGRQKEPAAYSWSAVIYEHCIARSFPDLSTIISTLSHSVIQVRYSYTSILLNRRLFDSPCRPEIYLLRKVKVEPDLSLVRDKLPVASCMTVRGHPTSIFGKYLFGRRFKIYNFRNICCKISCLPASPRIFEHLKMSGAFILAEISKR